MVGTKKVVHLLPELADRLYKCGLRDIMITALCDEPKMDLLDDFFRLSTQAKQKAYEAAVSKSNRKIMEFAKELVKDLGEMLEVNYSGDNDGVVPYVKPYNAGPHRKSSPTPQTHTTGNLGGRGDPVLSKFNGIKAPADAHGSLRKPSYNKGDGNEAAPAAP